MELFAEVQDEFPKENLPLFCSEDRTDRLLGRHGLGLVTFISQGRSPLVTGRV